MPVTITIHTPNGSTTRVLTDTENDPSLHLQFVIDRDINNNLPSWAQVKTSIDNANDIASLKIVIKKMARVLFLLAKNSDS